MNKIISPFYYQGEIDANASKSYLQRALLISALAKGNSKLINFQTNNDSLAVMKCLESIGAQFHFINESTLEVIPPEEIGTSKLEINVNESGLALRMLGTVLAVLIDDLTIHGESTLLKREQKALIELWEQIGFEVEHDNFKLPIRKKGKVSIHKIKIDASETSQILTGLLIALPYLKDTEIEVKSLASKPYIDMTIECIKQFKIEINTTSNTYRNQQPKDYIGTEYSIESDWSGIANHIIGAGISGSIRIKNVHFPSKQADAKIIDIAREIGISVSYADNTLQIDKGQHLKPFEVDITDCPDLFPVLVVLALACKGTTCIHGTNRLINKESNRLLAMTEMLDKLKTPYQTNENGISIESISTIRTEIVIDTKNDHRIAMAGSLLALFGLKVAIDNEACVSKSYPNFFKDIGLISHEI